MNTKSPGTGVRIIASVNGVAAVVTVAFWGRQ
jgi:hypothetical protein